MLKIVQSHRHASANLQTVTSHYKMTRIQFILTFIGAIFFGRVYRQDTVEYRQANAALFSNNYTFIKTNKTDKTGNFIQKTITDDGQCWIGNGTFKEKN
jgi:hypothetical protein